MESDISASKSSEEILRKLRALCCTYGQVEQIKLYCNKGSPRETICVIDMKGDMNLAAQHIKCKRLGYSALYKSLLLPSDFRCAERAEGELLSPVCSRCWIKGCELVAESDSPSNDHSSA